LDKKIIVAIAVGIAVYIPVIYLASVQRDLTGQQLILMLAAPFVVGIISGGVKNGLILGFLVSFIMLILESLVIMPGAFSNPNVAMTVVVMTLPIAGISLALGAAGGFLGKRVFKKQNR